MAVVLPVAVLSTVGVYSAANTDSVPDEVVPDDSADKDGTGANAVGGSVRCTTI